MTLVIDNIAELVTNDPELGDGPLGVVTDVSWSSTTTRWWPWAPQERLPMSASMRAVGACSPDSSTLTPTWCSRATGPRSSPGGWRASPTTEAGSGSPPRPRAAPPRHAGGFARSAAGRGTPGRTTTVEIKTGYGLSLDSEIELASLAAEVTPEATFLGAHLLPSEYEGRADDYIDLVCGRCWARCGTGPLDRRFCETGAFNTEQSRAVLEAAVPPGWVCGCSATSSATGRVCSSRSRWLRSVDHCTYLSDDDIEAWLAATPSPRSCRPPTSPPPAVSRCPAGHRRRRQGGDGLELQPGLQLRRRPSRSASPWQFAIWA